MRGSTPLKRAEIKDMLSLHADEAKVMKDMQEEDRESVIILRCQWIDQHFG